MDDVESLLERMLRDVDLAVEEAFGITSRQMNDWSLRATSAALFTSRDGMGAVINAARASAVAYFTQESDVAHEVEPTGRQSKDIKSAIEAPPQTDAGSSASFGMTADNVDVPREFVTPIAHGHASVSNASDARHTLQPVEGSTCTNFTPQPSAEVSELRGNDNMSAARQCSTGSAAGLGSSRLNQRSLRPFSARGILNVVRRICIKVCTVVAAGAVAVASRGSADRLKDVEPPRQRDQDGAGANSRRGAPSRGLGESMLHCCGMTPDTLSFADSYSYHRLLVDNCRAPPASSREPSATDCCPADQQHRRPLLLAASGVPTAAAAPELAPEGVSAPPPAAATLTATGYRCKAVGAAAGATPSAASSSAASALLPSPGSRAAVVPVEELVEAVVSAAAETLRSAARAAGSQTDSLAPEGSETAPPQQMPWARLLGPAQADLRSQSDSTVPQMPQSTDLADDAPREFSSTGASGEAPTGGGVQSTLQQLADANLAMARMSKFMLVLNDKTMSYTPSVCADDGPAAELSDASASTSQPLSGSGLQRAQPEAAVEEAPEADVAAAETWFEGYASTQAELQASLAAFLSASQGRASAVKLHVLLQRSFERSYSMLNKAFVR